MNFLNDCFNTMLEYGEAIKSSFVKGHVSDWPDKKKEATVTPEQPAPSFEVKKGYVVNNEESYNMLPESYRSTYGEWGTVGLVESLPWLAVEFTPTAAKELTIVVDGPVGFTKTITYPKVSKKVSLLTLNAEELETEITPGVWTITINDQKVTIPVDLITGAPEEVEGEF